jgi:hypothetical protein
LRAGGNIRCPKQAHSLYACSANSRLYFEGRAISSKIKTPLRSLARLQNHRLFLSGVQSQPIRKDTKKQGKYIARYFVYKILADRNAFFRMRNPKEIAEFQKIK